MSNVADSVLHDAGCTACSEPVATGPQFLNGRATMCPRHLYYALTGTLETLQTIRDEAAKGG